MTAFGVAPHRVIEDTVKTKPLTCFRWRLLPFLRCNILCEHWVSGVSSLLCTVRFLAYKRPCHRARGRDQTFYVSRIESAVAIFKANCQSFPLGSQFCTTFNVLIVRDSWTCYVRCGSKEGLYKEKDSEKCGEREKWDTTTVYTVQSVGNPQGQ